MGLGEAEELGVWVGVPLGLAEGLADGLLVGLSVSVGVLVGVPEGTARHLRAARALHSLSLGPCRGILTLVKPGPGKPMMSPCTERPHAKYSACRKDGQAGGM